MAAEVMGACVLTEIFDLVFNSSLNDQYVNGCIDTLLKNSDVVHSRNWMFSRMEKMKSGIDQMLRKTACPKVDVECVRHSDKRDWCLQKFPGNFFQAAPSLRFPLWCQIAKNHWEGDERYTTEALRVCSSRGRTR